MFAIAFDLVVAEAGKHHPRGVTAAYTDIGATLMDTAESTPARNAPQLFWNKSICSIASTVGALSGNLVFRDSSQSKNSSRFA